MIKGSHVAGAAALLGAWCGGWLGCSVRFEHSVSDDAKDILEKVFDDGDDVFEKVSYDAKDILEKVLDGNSTPFLAAMSSSRSDDVTDAFVCLFVHFF